MISIEIGNMIKNLVRDNSKGLIPKKNVYLYNVPEQVDVVKSLPIVKVSHVTSNATTHSSNDINFTKERFQIQFYYMDTDENDYESMIISLEKELRNRGIYYSTGYDSYDPDYDGVITITRQYNYRNKIN